MAIRRSAAAPRGARMASLIGGALLGLLSVCLLTATFTAPALAQPEWTTYHRDAARSGDDPDATQPLHPSLSWQSVDLGAPIWGQPLVLGGRVYVATVGDELYALNAADGHVEWQQSAGTPVPSEELPCGDITPTVGIVSTPLIDTSTKAIYVVADTWNAQSAQAEHLLESFNLQTGAPELSVPVDPPGVDPETILQRSALNLDEGQIVFGFGGNLGSCSQELAPLVAVPATGGPARFWQTHNSPFQTTAGGVWDPSGVAVDTATGDIYAATANPLPTTTIDESEYDYSDSVLQLSLADFVSRPAEESLTQMGWFKPPDWEQRSNNDLDLGSAGPELLPGGLLFQAGKDGVGYVIDEATMGSGAPAAFEHEVCEGDGSFGGDAYAGGTIYIPCTNGTEALSYNETSGTFSSLWHAPADAFGPPIVSGGLVWVQATGGFSGGGEKLYGLCDSNGDVLYEETMPEPIADHFGSPSAAGGRLFVATGRSVTAYQLSGAGSPAPADVPRPCPPPPGPTGASPGGGEAATRLPGSSSAGAGPGSGSPPTAPPAELLQTELHATSTDKVKLRLRCAAGAGQCAGSVTLNARLVVLRGRGAQRTRHTVLIRLAKASFHHPRGDFTLTISLSGAAMAHLRAHGNRLALRVAIASGARVRVVSAVLT